MSQVMGQAWLHYRFFRSLPQRKKKKWSLNFRAICLALIELIGFRHCSVLEWLVLKKTKQSVTLNILFSS